MSLNGKHWGGHGELRIEHSFSPWTSVDPSKVHVKRTRNAQWCTLGVVYSGGGVQWGWCTLGVVHTGGWCTVGVVHTGGWSAMGCGAHIGWCKVGWCTPGSGAHWGGAHWGWKHVKDYSVEFEHENGAHWVPQVVHTGARASGAHWGGGGAHWAFSF